METGDRIAGFALMGCAGLSAIIILIMLLIGLARSGLFLPGGSSDGNNGKNVHCEVVEVGPFNEDVICEPE